jgi:hypothetical protein
MCLCDSSEHNTYVQGIHHTADFNAKTLKVSYVQQKVKHVLYCSVKASDAVCKLLLTMDNFEPGDEITYRQWVTIDRRTLLTVVPCEEFNNHLTDK